MNEPTEDVAMCILKLRGRRSKLQKQTHSNCATMAIGITKRSQIALEDVEVSFLAKPKATPFLEVNALYHRL
jgi:hypothetical protein